MYELEIALKNAEKKLKEAEKKKAFFLNRYKKHGRIFDFELAKEAHDKAEKIKERLKRTKSAEIKDTKKVAPFGRLIKEIHIECMAYELGIEKVLICAGVPVSKATAIIDEIIESELNAEAKLLLIKMFIDNQIDTLQLDAILTE